MLKSNDFRSIIDFAVKNEVEAYEFYENATLKVSNEYLKEVFEGLAKEELQHKKFLTEFLASDIEVIKLDEFNDYKVAETIDKPTLSVEMNFTDAIGLAIKNEEEAMQMYNNLSQVCLDEEQKNLFIGLMNMEKMHKSRLEDIYINVAYAEVW